MTRTLVMAVLGLLGVGCSSLQTKPPPLDDIEEPPAFFAEPDDEEARLKLDKGSFTGIHVTDSRTDLESRIGEQPVPEGVLVTEVVENSPGRAVGIEPGDILLTAVPAGKVPVDLQWPGQWREIEINTEPGDALAVLFDRAGVQMRATMVTVPRLVAPPREETKRYREEQRLGMVVRNSTEVEARAANLPVGGGAVVVGLSAKSPLRKVGIQYGDVLAQVADRRVSHPLSLIEAIRTYRGEKMELVFFRGEEKKKVSVPLTERDTRVRSLWIPPLFTYSNDGETASTDILLWLFGWSTTDTAWEFRLFYFISFGSEQSDELKAVD